MSIILLTNASQYAGPGVLQVLCAQGHNVLCHDPVFAEPAQRTAFERQHPGARVLVGQTPEEIVTEAAELGPIDGLVSNDAFPNAPQEIEAIAVDTLRASFETLLVFPFRLCQLLLPQMKARRRGSIVLITSARPLQPEPGFAVATSIRAAASSFALALAREAAPYEVQVNAVAPNYLYSEMYYPRARFIDDPDGRAAIAARVPFGRLGTPEEIGELVAFLVSGRTPFVTGQIINFTGGWP